MTDSRLIEIFTELVQVDSVSFKERKIADHLKNYFENLGRKYSGEIKLRIEEDSTAKTTGSESGNIICEIGTGGDFVLLSHMDTVESTKDLNPVITEDRIMTEGKTILGSDNRAGIASILYALESVLEKKQNTRDFTIAFTTCEETSMGGSLNIELKDNIKSGFVFDSSYRPGKYIYSACGAIAFKIDVHGKASHSGISPEKGIHSIQIAAKAISELKVGRIDEETTLNIGLIKGGSAVNVVPELTSITGEIRSFDTDKILLEKQKLIDVFNRVIKSHGASYTYSDNWDFRPYTHSTDADLIKTLEKAMKKAGINPNPTISFGGSDANSLNGRGINAVNIGIGAQNPHSVEEFILIEDLIASSAIARNLIIKD
ncbi:MAG: M20/M25/M40 family metallo-hydrolase [Ignavibacteriales bacterium]|nr:M20/M25/M40 family metallo-hydrolase [Ignavibacteriales bacterium]MCF8315867.1 M20/M25/M40 family metallo-hydrolase [Ignavibacteriales bacterium]MCF8437327.1 M20/M25/M40 family metallo-hydrolase [Ignavibacteriales bacterium]